MSLQSDIEYAAKQMRISRFQRSKQLSLGKLIYLLEPIAKKQPEVINKFKHEAEVYFDFCHMFPTCIYSWRGAYDELALNHQRDGDPKAQPMKVRAFLKMLKAAVGKTYTGYKGGDFTMSKDTPVWVSNYGDADDTAVVGVLDESFRVLILTEYMRY